MKLARNFKQIVFLKTLALVFCNSANATSCGPGIDHGTPDKYREYTYQNSEFVGIVEVEKIENVVSEFQVAGRYNLKVTLKPIELIKGKIKKDIIFHYTGINNGIIEFQENKKYLMAFDKVDSNNETGNGICDWPFKQDAGSDLAKKSIEKFKSLKKKNSK